MDDVKNLPVVAELGAPINWSSNEVLNEVKNFVGENVPDATFTAFIGLCKYAGLNPFLREAWCVKFGSNWQIMTGINGYLKFANSHPHYDNYDEPEFEFDERDSKKPTKCTIRVWRKDRTRPVTASLTFDEAKGPGPRWSTHKKEMLEKATLAKALRRSFSELNNTYTEDEITINEGRIVEHGQTEGRSEQFARQVFEAGNSQAASQDAIITDTQIPGSKPDDSVGATQEPGVPVSDPLERMAEYTCPKTKKVVLMYEQFCYDISTEKSKDKLVDIKKYLQRSKAFFDDKYQVYRSTKALPRTANYLVDEPAIKRQQEIA